jgi:hypothetical protein
LVSATAKPVLTKHAKTMLQSRRFIAVPLG